MKKEKLKRDQKIYFLKPVYTLGGYRGVDFSKEEIIFEVKEGAYVAYSGFDCKYFVLPKGDTETREISVEWVFTKKKEAERACKNSNELAFHYLGKRVKNLETKVRELQKWAKSISLK